VLFFVREILYKVGRVVGSGDVSQAVIINIESKT
jgi:hypothetical protein